MLLKNKSTGKLYKIIVGKVLKPREVKKKKEDGLKVTSSRIKEIIERRKSENKNTTVDDVVEEINRDFPNATRSYFR